MVYNGKPYEQMDDLEENPLFSVQHLESRYLYHLLWISPNVCSNFNLSTVTRLLGFKDFTQLI